MQCEAVFRARRCQEHVQQTDHNDSNEAKREKLAWVEGASSHSQVRHKEKGKVPQKLRDPKEGETLAQQIGLSKKEEKGEENGRKEGRKEGRSLIFQVHFQLSPKSSLICSWKHGFGWWKHLEQRVRQG